MGRHADSGSGRPDADRLWAIRHRAAAWKRRAHDAVVAALLAVDPAQRPSAQQALEHPWLRPAAALPLAPYTLPSATQ